MNDVMNITAPMDPHTGKCTVCNDNARDCICWICPNDRCEETHRGDEVECTNCGYEMID